MDDDIVHTAGVTSHQDFCGDLLCCVVVHGDALCHVRLDRLVVELDFLALRSIGPLGATLSEQAMQTDVCGFGCALYVDVL
jgi:hypothetical protein